MWFLVAIMSLVYDGDQKDVFIWSDPTFANEVECVDFVQNNNYHIYDHLVAEFPGDRLDRLLCVEQERLKEFIQDSQAEQGDSI